MFPSNFNIITADHCNLSSILLDGYAKYHIFIAEFIDRLSQLGRKGGVVNDCQRNKYSINTSPQRLDLAGNFHGYDVIGLPVREGRFIYG